MEGALQVRSRGGFPNDQLEPEPFRGVLCLRQEDRRCLVRRVDEREQPPQPGHDLLVELELSDHRITCPEDTGQVAPRVGQACDEAVPNRIGRVQEDDWDRMFHPRRCSLRSGDGRVLERHDDVDVLGNIGRSLVLGLLLLEVAPDQLDPRTPDMPVLDQV